MLGASPVIAQEEQVNDSSKPYQYEVLPSNPDFSELPDGVYLLPLRQGRLCMVAVADDEGGASGRDQVRISLTCS